MSDSNRMLTTQENLSSDLHLSSDDEDSNSAGAHGWFDSPPRQLRGRAGRDLARRISQENEYANKENNALATVPLPSPGRSPNRSGSANSNQTRHNSGLWEVDTPPKSASPPPRQSVADVNEPGPSGLRSSAAYSRARAGKNKKTGGTSVENLTKKARYQAKPKKFQGGGDVEGSSDESGDDGDGYKAPRHQSGSNDEEDQGPPPLEAQECNLYGVEITDELEEKAASPSPAPTIQYGMDKVRYKIGLEGIITMDAPARAKNGLAAAIGNILDSKVTNSCGCHMEDARPSDPANFGKHFSSFDQSMHVFCSVPNMCNKIDITGSNYCAERELSPQQIMLQRNRYIDLGTEEHYYMGKKILRYEDVVPVGTDTMLYAIMGDDGNEMHLIKKDAVNVFLVR